MIEAANGPNSMFSAYFERLELILQSKPGEQRFR